MTTYGASQILLCSACSKPIEHYAMTSGNTFGAKYWTDTKQDAPMLPPQLWLVLCPHCSTPLWLDELQPSPESDMRPRPRKRGARAVAYNTPSFADYIALATAGTEPAEKQRYLRICALHAGNDARRHATVKPPLSSSEVANLAALAQCLDESDENDRLLKAEALRELSQFNDALLLLERTFSSKLAPAVASIRALVLQQDACVRELQFS